MILSFRHGCFARHQSINKDGLGGLEAYAYGCDITYENKRPAGNPFGGTLGSQALELLFVYELNYTLIMTTFQLVGDWSQEAQRARNHNARIHLARMASACCFSCSAGCRLPYDREQLGDNTAPKRPLHHFPRNSKAGSVCVVLCHLIPSSSPDRSCAANTPPALDCAHLKELCTLSARR